MSPPRDWLLTATVAYLFLPAFLFFFGWLRWYVGLPLALGALWGCVRILSGGCPDSVDPVPGNFGRLRRGLALGLCALAVFWSGVAGYTPEIGVADPFKQHMMLYEGMERPWPTAYESEEIFGKAGPRAPAYHVFFYLTPAAVGKLFGWEAANHFLALWVTLGLWLVILWIGRLARSDSLGIALAFLLLGGVDLLGQVIFDV